MLPSAIGVRSRAARAPALRAALATALLAGGTGCGRPPARVVTYEWWVGQSRPAFDPTGPQDAVRWSLERLLTRGLVEEDATGDIVPAAAGRFEFSPDSLTVTFHLRRDLRFTNGARCGSPAFRATMERGLARADHGTTAWALAAVRGVQAMRGGRTPPPLGILTPDDSTLVLELARRDPLLLRKLALPGIATAWAVRDSGTGWKGASGLGPYRVLNEDPRRLHLVRGRARRRDPAWPDTVNVRFESGAPRLRAALRAGRVDLLWPVPATMTSDPLPAPYRRATGVAMPARRLTLVMRADVPPTTKLAARRALAHGLDRSEVATLLGEGGRDPVSWWPGAPPFDFPSLDAGEVVTWLERGRLGRSFHVTMLLDADGAGTDVARSLQGEWARLNLSVDLLPLRGTALAEEALRGWRAQLILAERQPLIDDPGAELAGLVMPVRGPAVGPLRTGWRTREFDPWILSGTSRAPLDLEGAGQRLAEQLVALPVADLDWVWIERPGGPKTGLHPHFGPEAAASITPSPAR